MTVGDLSAKILAEGESAVKDYIKFLSGGCSTDPISLLKIAGVDIGERDTEYFRSGSHGTVLTLLDGLCAFSR